MFPNWAVRPLLNGRCRRVAGTPQEGAAEMKVGTPDLLKFQRLQRRLKESIRGTVGLLELLWQRVAKNCPRGDIGKFTDEEIACLCDWPGDPKELINALTDTGWLDACPTHRLVVHDWHEHAPAWVKGVVLRNGGSFATLGTPPKVPDPECGTQGVAPDPGWATQGGPPPYQAMPSQSKPSPPPESGDSVWSEVEGEVLNHGVALAGEAVRAAREAGCSINQVRNTMEFWRAHQDAYQPGALYERLKRLRPDQGFDTLWPEIVDGRGVKQVTAEEFRRLFEQGCFDGKPSHHATKPEVVYGTLRTGERIECRRYPLSKRNDQMATAAS